MARDLSRFLQPPTPRERAVRCPSEFDELMRLTGGLREAGSQRWLIPRWRINPLVRELRRTTDPLFRQAGIDLDEEGEAP